MRWIGRWSDERIEQVMGNLLRAGVLLAAAVVLFGGILYLRETARVPPPYATFRGEPSDLRSVTGIVRDTLALRSRGVIQFGLLLLIATPVARVAFSLVAFLIQRDRLYVVVTLFVLVVLAYSLVSGGL